MNVNELCTDQIENSTSPPGKPRAFDYFLCPGSGEFDFYLGGVGKIEPEVSGFKGQMNQNFDIWSLVSPKQLNTKTDHYKVYSPNNFAS